MPRNNSGNYTLPAGNPVIAGTLIEDTWANPTMADIGNEITASLPRNGSAPMTGPLILAKDATVDLEAVPLRQLNVSLGSAANYLPAGAVMAFAMGAIPTGWLRCDGSAVSRTTYAQLFAIIGTAYGSGDGITTFNIPDLRGSFIRGVDEGRNLDPARVFGSTQLPANQAHVHAASQEGHQHGITTGNHTHPIYDPGHKHVSYAGRNGSYGNAGAGVPLYEPAETSLNGTNISVYEVGNLGGTTDWRAPTITIGTQGSESRPHNVAMGYCIKAFGAVQTDGLGSMAFQNKEAVNITGGTGVFSSLQCTTAPVNPNDVARLADIGGQVQNVYSSDSQVLLVDGTDPQNLVLRPQTNVPSGMLKLNAAGYVPPELLNISDLNYEGPWPAGGANPPDGVEGDYYLIDTAGNLMLQTSASPNAPVSVPCNVGDEIIWLGQSVSYPTPGWYYNPAPVASSLPATAVSFAPAGTIQATNVQAAIEEVSGDVTALTAATANSVKQTSATGAIITPAGLQTERPGTPVEGHFRYNTDTDEFEGYTANGWGSVGGGQMYGKAPVKGIFYNSQTIGENITVATGQNGLSAGPISVSNGFTVTVNSGSVWTVV